MARCDALIRLEGWQGSEGATQEVLRAKEIGIPIFDTLDGLAYWLARYQGSKMGAQDRRSGRGSWGVMVAWDLHEYPLPGNYKEYIVHRGPKEV